MSKAQIMSGDFMISIAVFLLLLAIIMPAFLKISGQVSEEDDRVDIETASIFASDSMMKTAGYPQDWNATNVKVVGFANDDGNLNLSKIREFMKMDYGTARNVLFGGFNFNVTFTDIGGYPELSGAARSPAAYFYVSSNDVEPLLNSTGLAWDLYYGGTGAPDARDSGTQYTGQEASVFNTIVANSGRYKTIIIEDPQLTQDQVNFAGLQAFVKSGGVLVFKGGAALIASGLSMHGSSGAPASGTMSDDYMIGGQAGGIAVFANPSWYFYQSAGDSQLKTIVGTGGNALIGSWSYGTGKIYYLTASNATAGGLPLAINVAGKKIESGAQIRGGSVSVTSRIGIIEEKNDPVKITIAVWK